MAVQQAIIMYRSIETVWRFFASVNYIIIGLDSGLPPIWRQTDILINTADF